MSLSHCIPFPKGEMGYPAEWEVERRASSSVDLVRRVWATHLCKIGDPEGTPQISECEHAANKFKFSLQVVLVIGFKTALTIHDFQQCTSMFSN